MNWPVFLTLIRLSRIMCRAFSGRFRPLSSGVRRSAKNSQQSINIRGPKLNLHEHELENLPSPLFAKEGKFSSLWQREVRRDFSTNVVIVKGMIFQYVRCTGVTIDPL
jgi:hypothetical protein